MAFPINPRVKKNSREVDAEALHGLPSEQVHTPTGEQYPTEAERKKFFGISDLLAFFIK